MGENSSKFQIILIGAFVFFIILGVLIFATFQSKGTERLPPITLWGTVPTQTMTSLLQSEPVTVKKMTINYVEKDPRTFDQEFTNALSEGRGPDLVLLPEPLLFKERNKLSTISYDIYPAREFKDTFIESAEVLARGDGLIALPFSIDPLVLYWNRQLFTNAGVVSPPQSWDDVSALVEKLSQVDNNSNVRKAAIPLGAYTNVEHAKDILSALFMQSGSVIVKQASDSLASDLISSNTVKTADALSFYTSFGDPTKANYSWNRSLPSSAKVFSDGTAAMYVGFASELPLIHARNPNLNFDVTALPQIKGGNRSTYGLMQVFAIPRQSRYGTTALEVARLLSSSEVAELYVSQSRLPPVRRDLLKTPPADAYLSVFYNSALFSKVWIDPDPARTETIFKNLIEGITSGRNSSSEALSEADDEINSLLNMGN